LSGGSRTGASVAAADIGDCVSSGAATVRVSTCDPEMCQFKRIKCAVKRFEK